MPGNELTIDVMQKDDLPVLAALRAGENWNQTPRDLERYLKYEPEGCFLARWDGVAAGTVTTTTYGEDLGWIGMMLVHPDYRRRGIASALLGASLDYLTKRGTRCIKLDATPAGRFVYERMGFRAEWEFERWERPGTKPIDLAARNSADFRLPESDTAIFGADRSGWLKLVAEDSKTIEKSHAFGMLRPGARAAYLGPVIAENPSAARDLILELTARCESTTIWDVPGPNTAAVEIAQSLGFQPVRQLLRMWTGRELRAGDVLKQYALADPSTG